MSYYAHRTEENWQTLKDHLDATAKYAQKFSIPELKNVAYFIGLMHDIGKYQESFQKRLEGKDIQIPHSMCGAIEIEKALPKTASSISAQYCISGHHTGLQDYGSDKFSTKKDSTLCGVLKRKEDCEDYSKYKNEITPTLPDEIKNLLLKKSEYKIDALNQDFAFLTRYLFSCLIDADYLDTQEFCNGYKQNTLKSDFESCLNLINNKINGFKCDTELQKARKRIQQQVYDKTNKKGNIFLLDMPTGSGKTLCSMKFALEKAIKTNKKIIYVIPYNSIIDQTADVFSDLFKDKLNILRHQSTFVYEDKDGNELYKYKKYIENWDSNFIITTMVQFFESLYSNKKGKLRKLHNIQDAIIIIDEAHLMPIEYLQPCLNAIYQTTKFLNTEVLFLTATMPDFNKLLIDYCGYKEKIIDLVPDKKDYKYFEKNTFKYIGAIDDEILTNDQSVSKLIVVNSKKKAREIYDKCKGNKYYLSTYLTGKDRAKIIKEIGIKIKSLKEEYENNKAIPEGKRITVVSTSLIEAGVDLDFHTVFRELTGFDSILQTAGRCNREGLRDKKDSKVYIFEFRENMAYKISYDVKKSITKNILINELKDNCDIDKLNKNYFNGLHTFFKNIIIKHKETPISNTNLCAYNFSKYNDKFKLIKDEENISIVIPNDDKSKEYINKLKNEEMGYVRKLQIYMATIKKSELEKLLNLKVVGLVNGIYYLKDLNYYNSNTGVLVE